MNRTQIAALYDSFTPEEQDMPRETFIKRMSDALDPSKMATEANRIARGRIQQAQNKIRIDAAIKRSEL